MKKLLTILLTLVLGIGLIAIKTNNVQAEENDQYLVSVNLFGGTASEAPTGWTLKPGGAYEKNFDAGTTYATILKEWEGKFSKAGKAFTRWYPVADDTPLTSNKSFTAQWKDPEYLTFTAVEANSTVTFKWTSATSVSYKTNAMSDWATYTINTPITLTNVGDTVSFKGTNVITNNSGHFSMTGKIAASGDVTSLTNGVGGDTALAQLSCACMFMDCTSLTTVPNLPSTSLAHSCYTNMFSGCTGLTSVPSDLLPSMALAEGCYCGMFYNCTNLTNIPDLPATTLAKSCYAYMFEGCSKIKVIQSDTKAGNYVIPFKLPNDTAATNPVTGMFKDTGGTFKGTPLLDTQYYIETTSTPTECTGTACSISATKGTNGIVAHISTITPEQFDFMELEGVAGRVLVNGADYTLYKGSLGVSLTKSFVDTLGEGNHQIKVTYDDDYKTYMLNITITGDSPTPSPSEPSKKDESCEKVIGPTWHWNNSKGICEDYGVVGTSTR